MQLNRNNNFDNLIYLSVCIERTQRVIDLRAHCDLNSEDVLTCSGPLFSFNKTSDACLRGQHRLYRSDF